MRDKISTSVERMVIANQSIGSLVDKDEQKPDLLTQTCQVLPYNVQHTSSFIKGKHSTDRNSVPPLNNSLSLDIQQEAADYLLQLKKQSSSFKPSDSLIYNQTLGKRRGNTISNGTPKYFAYPGTIYFFLISQSLFYYNIIQLKFFWYKFGINYVRFC